MRRAEIKWGLMKHGIIQWWNKNWLYVIAGIAAALIIFVAAEIFTGGAITAALPVILPILAYVFAGISVIQFAGYFINFLELAWGGKTQEATHKLSRGLGAALIELAMFLGFGVLKLAGKAVKAIAKGVLQIGKQVFKAIIRGAKFLIEKAKVIFKGIAGKGLGKVSKSIGKFADNLLGHTRFKKFRISFVGKKLVLEGLINPWVVIMETGELKTIDFNDINIKGKKIGDDILIDGEKKRLLSMADKLPEDQYRRFWQLFNNQDPGQHVIHHLIEKGKRYAYLFKREFIHAPARLKAIPKGDINSILHLSDIRTLWDDVYRVLDTKFALNLIDDAKASKGMLQFADHSAKYIDDVIEEVAKAEIINGGKLLTKDQIKAIVTNMRSKNGIDDLINNLF